MNTDENPFRCEADKLLAELFGLEKDAAYEELLRGKNVIVVGPARTLQGRKQGRMIDAFDLVVRFNNVIEYLPFSDELAEDIGARTDILYSNNAILMQGVLDQTRITHEQFTRLANQLGIKHIISTNNNFSYEKAAAGTPKCYAEQREFQRLIAERNIQSHFSMMFSLPDMARRWMGGYLGRTGFLALLDLLRYDIGRLHIAGMTFYHRGGHLFLDDNASELHPLENRRDESQPNPEIRGHNSYLELEIMKVLARHFRHKLEMDAELQALLEDDA